MLSLLRSFFESGVIRVFRPLSEISDYSQFRQIDEHFCSFPKERTQQQHTKSNNKVRPVSDADLSVSQTKYLELSTWKVLHTNPIKKGYFNLERLRHSSCLAWPRRNGFDSNTELFMRRFHCMNYFQLCLKTLRIWGGLPGTRRLNQQASSFQFWSVKTRIKYGSVNWT